MLHRFSVHVYWSNVIVHACVLSHCALNACRAMATVIFWMTGDGKVSIWAVACGYVHAHPHPRTMQPSLTTPPSTPSMPRYPLLQDRQDQRQGAVPSLYFRRHGRLVRHLCPGQPRATQVPHNPFRHASAGH